MSRVALSCRSESSCIMNLKQYFYSSFYYIAYRHRNDGGINSEKMWHALPSRSTEWFADPFLFEWEGRTFLFVERMNRWRLLGSIAVCEIYDDNSVSHFKEILVEPFHLSYPNVFEYNGKIYMIPESGHNYDIRLYVSKCFPDKWEFVKVLYSGANFVDTSFISGIKDGHAVMCSLDWCTRVPYYFSFDLDKLSLLKLPDNPQMIKERSGGNYFEEENGKYRVLQDCTKRYGSKIMICRIEDGDFEHGKGAESKLLEVLPHDLKLDINHIPVACHTYNRSSKFEVVDFLCERFIWYGPVSAIRNKVFYEKNKDSGLYD